MTTPLTVFNPLNMKKLHFLLLIAAAVSFIVFSTSSTSTNMIYWSEDYQLTWDDFQAAPDYEKRNASALSASGIVHSKGCKNGQIIYEVLSYFEKNESWVKEEARTDYHLKHEQIHFDITELYARKLREALSKEKFRCGQEAEFENFVSQFITNWHQAQHNYDASSQHSMDKAAQAEWNKQVEIELENLEAFK